MQKLKSFTAIAVAGLLAMTVLGSVALGDHKPADKVAGAGAETEVVGPGEEIVLLSEEVRTADPTDLVLSVTAECSIVTNVTTVGNDEQRAFGEVKVWVEIDGEHVAVSSADSDAGRVVFCNRAYQRRTTNFDDEDATIETFFETRQANGFNWMALNVGHGVHTIEVKATLTEEATNNATAEAVVGNRTLIVEPTKASTHEQL